MRGVNFNFQDLNMPKAFWIMVGTAFIILSLAAAIALVWYGQVIFIFKSNPADKLKADKEAVMPAGGDDDATLIKETPSLEDEQWLRFYRTLKKK